MGQPKTRLNGPQLFHVNFHTLHNRAVFEVPEYLTLAERELRDAMRKWKLPVLAWTVMPTHVHLVVMTFPDLPLGRVLRLLKGRVAHELLAAAPEPRADLGDHLWQEGYDWVEIVSHRQFLNAVNYVRENRRRGGVEE